MSDLVHQAIEAIIRPPRSTYNLSTFPNSLSCAEFNETFNRFQITIRNERNLDIQGSIYHSMNKSPMEGGPCMIYMHGNASSQLEGQFLVPNFCSQGIFVFLYDAAGCGCSEGDYISLGYYEKPDVEYIMQFLHNSFGFGPFVIWGRSMGAATSVLVRSPYLAGIVVDSTYTSIYDMCSAIATTRISIPSWLFPPMLWFIKGRIESLAGFDISTVSPLESAKSSQVPALFGHASDDDLVPFEQGRAVFEAYSNPDKEQVILCGGHNGVRPLEWIRKGVLFSLRVLGFNTENVRVSDSRRLQRNEMHFESFDAMMAQINANRHH